MPHSPVRDALRLQRSEAPPSGGIDENARCIQQAQNGHIVATYLLVVAGLQLEARLNGSHEVLRITEIEVEVDLLGTKPLLTEAQRLVEHLHRYPGRHHISIPFLHLEQDELACGPELMVHLVQLGRRLFDLRPRLSKVQRETQPEAG